MAGRLWTEQELDQLAELAGRGWSASRIGRGLGRPADVVWRKRRALGLPPAGDPWRGSSALGSSSSRSRKAACTRWHGPDCRCWVVG